MKEKNKKHSENADTSMSVTLVYLEFCFRTDRNTQSKYNPSTKSKKKASSVYFFYFFVSPNCEMGESEAGWMWMRARSALPEVAK